MDYKSSFGASTFKRRLILIMEEKGLSQQAVADFSGVSQGTVSRWLSGSRPELKNVTSLASRVGVSVSWLAHGEGHLKLAYHGIDGFIHRVKSKIIPRLNDVIGSFSRLEEAPFLAQEERDMFFEIERKLRGRRARLAACVEALEKLPPGEGEAVNEILSRYKPSRPNPPDSMVRDEICFFLGQPPDASDKEILEGCRVVLQKNPKPKARKKTNQSQ